MSFLALACREDDQQCLRHSDLSVGVDLLVVVVYIWLERLRNRRMESVKQFRGDWLIESQKRQQTHPTKAQTLVCNEISRMAGLTSHFGRDEVAVRRSSKKDCTASTRPISDQTPIRLFLIDKIGWFEALNNSCKENGSKKTLESSFLLKWIIF
jgi:hypothetical protein